jgi:hypothetical protein
MTPSLSAIRRLADRGHHAQAYSALVDLLDNDETPDELVWALMPLEKKLGEAVPERGLMEALAGWIEKRKAGKALSGVKK